jgi:plasmid stability protein
MLAIHVRNLDPTVVEALKERARRHNRSLEGEVREILARAAHLEGLASPSSTAQRRLDLHRVATGSTSATSRDEIYDDAEAPNEPGAR